MKHVIMPLQFEPILIFDERKHLVDVVANAYLEKAAHDMHHLIPVEVDADGNCLYNSIVLLMDNIGITTSELCGIKIEVLLLFYCNLLLF